MDVFFESIRPAETQVPVRDLSVMEVADELERIQNHFRQVYGAQGKPDFAMEVEFKITSENVLVFKQARPWID